MEVFVQIIEGRAADVDGMQQLLQTWINEIRPGAPGFLGTTGGVTEDGRAIALVRFESADAAAANSARAEQAEWWSRMEACYDGDVSFVESDDVEEFLGGGSDDAGFVQVMKAQGIDRAAVARLDSAFQEHAPEFRPDILGGMRVWTGADAGYDVTYFTSEAEARAAEAKPLPPEFAHLAGDMEQIMSKSEFFDLTDPWLH